MHTHFFYAIILLISSSDCKISYVNHTLFRALPVNTSQINFLLSLYSRFNVDFWKDVGLINNYVDFVVNPSEQPKIRKEAENLGLRLTPLIDDLQAAFDAQTVKSYIRRNMHTMNWDHYYRLDDIYNWLRDLAEAYPNEVRLINIGRTFYNREILGVRVVLGKQPKRSTVIIEGGIHAREWISPTFVMYFIAQILNSPNVNNQWKEIGRTYEWCFIPVLNPDGYEYSHTTNRLWRKNLNYPAVDLNRNFDVLFGTPNNNMSADFKGYKPFSETESASMASFIRSKSHYLEYYITFHSYGQFLIIPYTFSSEHLDNYDKVLQMCRQMSSDIFNHKYQTSYKCGTAYETVGYLATGVSGCWVKRTFRVPYVLIVELRDSGKEGFALSTDKILPTCEETMAGLVSFLSPQEKQIRKLPSLKKKSKSRSPLRISDEINNVFCYCLFSAFLKFV